MSLGKTCSLRFFSQVNTMLFGLGLLGASLAVTLYLQISSEEEGVITLLGAYGEDGGRMHGMQENEVMMQC